MLFPIALVLSALSPAPVTQDSLQQADFAQARFKSLVDGQERIVMHVKLTELQPAKTSPMFPWKFVWTVSGLGRVGAATQFNQRVRVFAQKRDEIEDTTYSVGRMAMRMWDYNVQYLTLDHHERYMRTVDIYLAQGGTAGGEQRLVPDPEVKDPYGRTVTANVVHIYRMDTFTNARERAREVAHEYGHATLPAIGGYSAPESWANGDVGERLYLTWLYRDMQAGTAGWFDTVGATKEDLAAYLKEKVDPLLVQIGTNGVRADVLAGTDRGAFMEYVALVVYAEAMLPREAFARFMLLTGDGHGKQALPEFEFVVGELDEWDVRIPAALAGKDIWLPIGTGSVATGQVVSRRGKWAKVKPVGGRIVVRRRQ